MKKSIIIIVLFVIILIVIIFAVKMIPKEQNINMNIQELAKELSSAPIYENNLSEIDKDSIIKKYNFNEQKIKNIVSYVGTGATAEEILIIELLDKKDIEETKQIIETKIDERKSDFQNYLPKEVSKLENYYLISKGNYIILCISNNYDKADEIIMKYMKG